MYLVGGVNVQLDTQNLAAPFPELWDPRSYTSTYIAKQLIGDRIIWRKQCSNNSTGLSLDGISSTILKCSMFLNDEKNIETVLIIVMRTYKTVLIKPCINRKDKSTISPFSYAGFSVKRTVNFLVVVTPPYIYIKTHPFILSKNHKNTHKTNVLLIPRRKIQ